MTKRQNYETGGGARIEPGTRNQEEPGGRDPQVDCEIKLVDLNQHFKILSRIA